MTNGDLLGRVLSERDGERVTVCRDCLLGDDDGAPAIRDGPAYGAAGDVPYPECFRCGEVMRPETLEELEADGGIERPSVLGSFSGEEVRVRRVPIVRRALELLLREDVDVVEGVPRDATVESVSIDHSKDRLEAIVRSEEFDPVDLERERIPLLRVAVEETEVTADD